ncbi:WGR domain-containing protein (plasmid) [Microvirga terrae]|uniref:WGR domain-containing protein n=1 Tax=Microvirga terrae TaxID=2740529 RepID=A0ABY5S091_9HYPH|nr:WGR domain-containing protein [Microvirga terrae]UVF22886.1 WGR domain-containing protein [Microvirga terrae]
MRQLSFAFLLAGSHAVRGEPTSGSSASEAGTRPVTLRRIDPARNMRRFYSLEVEWDLLGNVVLVRRWGRIGSAGKVRLDAHAGEGEALAALQALQMAKARKGYQPMVRA